MTLWEKLSRRIWLILLVGWVIATLAPPASGQILPGGGSCTACDPSTCPQPSCPDCSSMCDPSTCPSVQTTIMSCRKVIQKADGSIIGLHCTVGVGPSSSGGN